MAQPAVKLEWDRASLAKAARNIGIRKEQFEVELAEGMIETIRHLIRSRTGTLAASWKWVRRGGLIVLSSRTPYSFASVRGAFIRPKRAKVLAFPTANGMVFAKAVRYPPGAYLGRAKGVGSSKSYLDDAVLAFKPVADAAFKASFGGLHREGWKGTKVWKELP